MSLIDKLKETFISPLPLDDLPESVLVEILTQHEGLVERLIALNALTNRIQSLTPKTKAILSDMLEID